MSQRESLSVAEIGLVAGAAFALVGRSLSPTSAPHNVALALVLLVALIACLVWRRGEALARPGGAVLLISVMAWLIWLGERVRLEGGALGIADWPPSVVTLVGWATVAAWIVARLRGRGGGARDRGSWIVGAWTATAVVALLAVAMFVVMRRGGMAPAGQDLVELLNWALLYGALFTVAMHQFVGTRARRGAIALAVILLLALVLPLLPIEIPIS